MSFFRLLHHNQCAYSPFVFWWIFSTMHVDTICNYTSLVIMGRPIVHLKGSQIEFLFNYDVVFLP